MIRFSGLEPYSDIAIEEIGLRPGEKLYEELLVNREQMQKTENDLIFVEKEELLSREEVDEKLRILREAVEEYGQLMPSVEITEALRRVVPTFRTPEEINSSAETHAEMQNTNELAHV
jgi:FlaA1/EpsC-like NDP-sugar epimerase